MFSSVGLRPSFRQDPWKMGREQNCVQLSWTVLELDGLFPMNFASFEDVIGACWTKAGLNLATSPQ